MAVSDSEHKCHLIMTFSSTRSITGASETRRPRDLHSFARVIMVLAWAPFWFNAAFFLCGEAVAAAIDGRSDNVSRSVSAAQPARAPDSTHSGCRDHRSNSPCGYTLNAAPAINGVYAGLPTDRVHFEWFAIDITVAADLTTANRSANRAPRAYYAPPPFRLYLRTLRLLI
jgi:hypothetical protein